MYVTDSKNSYAAKSQKGICSQQQAPHKNAQFFLSSLFWFDAINFFDPYTGEEMAFKILFKPFRQFT